MEFLKKNYEKVVLGVVLLGLIAATVLLLMRVSNERDWLRNIENLDVRAPKTDVPVADLADKEAVLKRLGQDRAVELDQDHNLFNPVQWQKNRDGNLIKVVSGNEVGPGALEISKITPLRMIVSYEGATVLGSETLHRFRVTREAERNSRDRRPITLQATGKGAKNDIFILSDLRPNAQNPKEFVLEMIKDRTQITVSEGNPYMGVAGYMADLKYPPERQVYLNKRVDDNLIFAGDTNRIVAISSNSVTLEAVSNRKRTTVLQAEPSETEQ